MRCFIVTKSSKLFCYMEFQKSIPDDRKNRHALGLTLCVMYYLILISFHKYFDTWSFRSILALILVKYDMFDVRELLGKG